MRVAARGGRTTLLCLNAAGAVTVVIAVVVVSVIVNVGNVNRRVVVVGGGVGVAVVGAIVVVAIAVEVFVLLLFPRSSTAHFQPHVTYTIHFVISRVRPHADTPSLFVSKRLV